MRFLTALAWLVLAMPAPARAITVTDSHGEKHGLGYLGRQVGAENLPHWTPGDEELAALPANFDSRELGFVSPIQDQRTCGSCWDFSMTKSLESARLSAGLPYVDLSEQDALVNDRQMEGCNGGYMDATWWVKHGQTTEALCPYRASTRFACRKQPVTKGYSWAIIGMPGQPPKPTDLMAAIVKFHVISTTVAASGPGSDFEVGGVMTDCSNAGVDHMVNAVGYRTLPDGTVRFIAANSWGRKWGPLAGFFELAQGCDQFASTPESALYIQYQ